MFLLKSLVIAITAWIATVWPSSWTGLLLTTSTSVLCLSLAYEQYRQAPSRRLTDPLTT